MTPKTASTDRLDAIRSSALWAAYGDALGFISELATTEQLIQRTGSATIQNTIPWKRRVGGRFGVTIELPAGCYSDDTQLRLATCRAIRGDGTFDVEVFSRVELPVWLAYALGGGRGVKAGASSLARAGITWATNFFHSDGIHYVDGGGNGAAMRIQPHVWAARRDQSNRSLILDVVRNSVVTHGHPRGILGAAFHALSLRYALDHSQAPPNEAWSDILEELSEIPAIISADDELSTTWVPLWERETSDSLADAFARTIDECLIDISRLDEAASNDPVQFYRDFAESIGALDESCKGSAVKTAILANVLSVIFEREPHTGLCVSANFLGSDTDTISTMAGAILGAVRPRPIPGAISDENYIIDEADRMYSISQGLPAKSFSYPDLLKWHAPKTQLEAISETDQAFTISGLGTAVPYGPVVYQSGRQPAIWQWFRLDHGQTILARRRQSNNAAKAKPKPERAANIGPAQQVLLPAPTNLEVDTTYASKSDSTPPPASTKLPRNHESVPLVREDANAPPGPNIDDLSNEAVRTGFDPKFIGETLIQIARSPKGVENAIGFAAIIAKAIRFRVKRVESSER